MRKGLKKLQGFEESDDELIELSDHIHYAVVKGDRSRPDYSVTMVASNLLNRLTALFKTYTFNGDVHSRLGGRRLFFVLYCRELEPPLSPKPYGDQGPRGSHGGCTTQICCEFRKGRRH